MFADLISSSDRLTVHAGEPFRQVLPWILIAALLLAAAHLVRAAVVRRPAEGRPRFNLWEKLTYLVTLAGAVVLAGTAFYAVLRQGELTGWALLAHMVGAGLFVFALPLLAVTWCEHSRFRIGPEAETGKTVLPRFFWLPKLMFWVFLASGLATTTTMLLSMLPVYGTEGMDQLLDIHRYSGLVVIVALLFHVHGVVLQRLRWR